MIQTSGDRERLNEIAHEWLSSNHPRCPQLTGRFYVIVPPSHYQRNGYRSKLLIEVSDTANWEGVFEGRNTLPSFDRVQLVLPGFRGAGEKWLRFPHEGYDLEAPLPHSFVQGRFELNPLRPPSKAVWYFPMLTDEGRREFARLGLRDYRLSSGANRNYGYADRKFYCPYAVFRDEHEWMTAKMRF